VGSETGQKKAFTRTNFIKNFGGFSNSIHNTLTKLRTVVTMVRSFVLARYFIAKISMKYRINSYGKF